VAKRKSTTIGIRELKKLKILGQGAFGKVWLCTAMQNGEIVPYALKVINKRQVLRSKQERSVLREKELLSMLNHPFILSMVSCVQDDMYLYLVLPLIQGGELFDVITDRSGVGRGIAEPEAAFYAAGIIEALVRGRMIGKRINKKEPMITEIGMR
jgi:serine/threonine protein kinase